MDSSVPGKELGLALLAKRKWTIAFSSAVFVIFAVVALLLLPPVYRAEGQYEFLPDAGRTGRMSLGAGGALSSLAAGLGGGLLAPQDGVQPLIERLKSRSFQVEFASEQELQPVLFSENWDETNGRWIDDSLVPSDWDISQRMKKVIRVSLDGKTGLVRIGVDWHDPSRSVQLLEAFVAKANDNSREEAKRRTEERVGYLLNSLKNSSQAELRSTISDLIKSEIERDLMISIDPEFVLKTVSAPLVPDADSPTSPDKTLLLSAALFFGLLMGLTFAYCLEYKREWRVSNK